MTDLNPYRRKNPYYPFDAAEDQPDDSGMYGPTPMLGGGGQPSGLGLFTPPPTSVYEPNKQDPLRSANFALYGQAGGDIGVAPPKASIDIYRPTADVTQSAPRAPQTGITGKAKAQVPAQATPADDSGMPNVPPPRTYTADDPEVKANMGWVDRMDGAKRFAVAQQMSAMEERRYERELTAAVASQQHKLQSEYARNQGWAYPEGKLLQMIADPNTAPEQKAWAQDQLDKTRRFNTPQPKEQNAFSAWREQNPTAPISDWFKIQPSVQGAQIRLEAPAREPTPNFSQADVRLKDGTSVPGSFNSHTGKYYDARGQEIPPDQISGASRVGGPNQTTPEDVNAIADAIISGKRSPVLRGFYRNAAPIAAELARRGYDAARAEQDWNATSRFLSTLNNPQQVRLRQAITFAKDSVPLIDQLYDHLNEIAPRSGFRIINKATIAAMKQLPGDAGATAQAIETQLNHLTGELGNIYMGGNSPTDMALRLGANAMEKDWNIETWKKNRDLLIKNLEIRANSIATSAPQGVTPGSSYAPPQAGPHTGGGSETPESVRADFKAKKITREQARQKLEAMGIK